MNIFSSQRQFSNGMYY